MDKSTLGLINGLSKRTYFNEDITNDFLREELYPETSEADFQTILQKIENILKTIVYSDMDFAQLEAFLTSQTKKREEPLREEQAAAISKFWRSNKDKIHNVLVDKASWNNRLKSMNWRIDVQMQTKADDNVNKPSAIFDLDIESRTPIQVSL